jgi:hypothetical protein
MHYSQHPEECQEKIRTINDLALHVMTLLNRTKRMGGEREMKQTKNKKAHLYLKVSLKKASMQKGT